MELFPTALTWRETCFHGCTRDCNLLPSIFILRMTWLNFSWTGLHITIIYFLKFQCASFCWERCYNQELILSKARSRALEPPWRIQIKWCSLVLPDLRKFKHGVIWVEPSLVLFSWWRTQEKLLWFTVFKILLKSLHKLAFPPTFSNKLLPVGMSIWRQCKKENLQDL